MYLGGDGFHMVAPLLQQVITLFPERGETYLVMAEILVYEEQFDEADQFFEQALDLNPDRKWWYLQRARAARDSDNNPAAMDYYIKTIQLFPEFKHAYHDLAKLYLSNEKLELAKETIEIAIQLDKSPTARIFVDAGKIYEALGESAKAENAYQQALVIDPDNKAALRGLLNLNAEGE